MSNVHAETVLEPSNVVPAIQAISNKSCALLRIVDTHETSWKKRPHITSETKDKMRDTLQTGTRKRLTSQSDRGQLMSRQERRIPIKILERPPAHPKLSS